MVMHQFSQRIELAFRRHKHFAFAILVDPVVVNAALVSQRDAALAGTAFRLPYEKTAVYPRTQEILGSVPRYSPMVPRVFLQRIHGSHVIRRYPSHLSGARVGLAPFTAFVVT